MNIIFVGLLAKDRFTFLIKNNFYDIIMNGVTIMHGQLKNGIYILSQSVSVMYTSNNHFKVDNVMDSYLWRCRLGYINKNKMNRLSKVKIFEINNCESLPTCEFYLFEKMTKSLFTEKDERASDVLSLVHTDVCRPINQVPKMGIIT